MKKIPPIVVLALLLALPGAALGAPVAETEVSPNMVTWRPTDAFHKLSLTVVGPDGQRLERVVDGGGVVSLSTIEKVAGFQWTEGTYKYELRTVAEPRQRGLDKAAAGRVQSGSFTMRDGALVLLDAAEPGPAPGVPEKVVVHNQDTVIQGSLCVGLDCVSSENFGFDTIRLKENNTRIKFQDTSVGTFPSTDWQLTANDSANGGLNRFSIEDVTAARVPFTVEGGAPTNALYVDSTGRVGLGTSAPSVEIHVVNGDSPTLRLQQDGSSGFTPQTWDMAGNETNFFVRDLTNGSKLPFRIRPNAPTSSIDIAADGNVGIGTTSPDRDLEVENSGAAAIGLSNTSTANGPAAKWFIQADDDANRVLNVSKEGTGGVEFQVNDRLDANGVATLIVNGSVQATNVTFSSSREVKDDFETIDPVQVLNQVAGLPILQWRYKTEAPGIRHMGPTAETFAETFGLGKDSSHITMSDLDGVALAAIQGLLRQVNELRDQNLRLRERLDAIEQNLE